MLKYVAYVDIFRLSLDTEKIYLFLLSKNDTSFMYIFILKGQFYSKSFFLNILGCLFQKVDKYLCQTITELFLEIHENGDICKNASYKKYLLNLVGQDWSLINKFIKDEYFPYKITLNLNHILNRMVPLKLNW